MSSSAKTRPAPPTRSSDGFGVAEVGLAAVVAVLVAAALSGTAPPRPTLRTPPSAPADSTVDVER